MNKLVTKLLVIAISVCLLAGCGAATMSEPVEEIVASETLTVSNETETTVAIDDESSIPLNPLPEVNPLDDGRLIIEGNKILKAYNNSEFVFNGVCTTSSNDFDGTCYTRPSYWIDYYSHESIATVKSWGVNYIRVAIEPNPRVNDIDYYLPRVAMYIDDFISQGIYVSVFVGANGSNIKTYKDNAMQILEYMADRYEDNPYVLYEVHNEYNTSDISWDEVKAISEEKIDLIREYAPSALVIVDGPHISDSLTDFTVILDDPVDRENVIYAGHVYGGGHDWWTYANEMLEVKNAGYPVFISEWNSTMSNGTDGFYEAPANMINLFCAVNSIGSSWFQMSDWNGMTVPSITGSADYDASLVHYGQWDETLPDSVLTDSGLYFKNHSLGKVDYTKYCMMQGYAEGSKFWADDIRQNVESIDFNQNVDSSKVIESWDVSYVDGTGMVMAYITDIDNDALYELHIVAKQGEVYAPTYCNYLFADFDKLTGFKFDGFDMSYVYSADSMFRGCVSIVEFSGFPDDLSHLRKCNSMFDRCSNLKTLDMSNCDMTFVCSVPYMFCETTNLEEIYLGDIAPEKVDEWYKGMFSRWTKGAHKTDVYVQNNEDLSELKKILADQEANIIGSELISLRVAK